jgi:hypothetical protein
MMTWIHNVYLVAMTQLTFFNLSIGMLPQAMVYYYVEAWLFAGSRSVHSLFDTHILQSILAVTSSNFILWGELCYTLFCSPQWSSDNMCSCSQKEPFSMRKVIVFLFSKTLSRKVITPCNMHGLRRCLIIASFSRAILRHLHRLSYA